MATNDFLAYADSGGANVITQATYAAASYLSNGLGSGILASNIYNKMIRQGSISSYMCGQIIVDYLGVNAADNSDLVTLLANFKAALAAPSAVQPTRIVTASFTLNLSCTSDYAIGLLRTASLSAMTINLAATGSLVTGQVFEIADLSSAPNGVDSFNVTVTPPGGHTIAGLSTFVMNVARQSARFRYFGSSTWSLDT
jgi:hypothetical protein